MKIEIDRVKGFADYLPPESLMREEIKKVVKKWFALYGFSPVETPIVEYDELMKNKDNEQDEAVSDRFRLQDKGNRELGLRYEFTFQLARILKQNPNIKMPFKRFQIGPVFRDEPIRAGRTRQFTQCDVDIVGDSSINADAECIASVYNIFKELKINTMMKINNRKLLNAIIASVQIKATQSVLRELDKMEKIGEDEVKANLKKYASPSQIITLLKLLDKDLDFFVKNAFEGAEDIEELMDKCKLYGVKTKFTPTLVRGFAYYTGNIFEAVLEDGKTAIAGGGRFDKVVGKFLPNDIPAVGFSFSLEALMGLCKTQLEKMKIPTSPKVLLLSIGQDGEVIKLAKLLRKSNVSCSLQSGKPGKALDYANALSIPYVVFIGEEEISQSKVKLKDMKSGKETLLSEKQILNKLVKS